VLPGGGAAGAGFAGARAQQREGDDHGRGGGEAHHGADHAIRFGELGGRRELHEEQRAGDHREQAQHAVAGVEGRLLEETALAVEAADQRRVQAVQEHHGRPEAHGRRDVFGFDGGGDGAREGEETGGRGHGEDGVDRERAAKRGGGGACGGARYRAGDALDRGRHDDVVDDGDDGEDPRDLAVAGDADQQREDELLGEAEDDEGDLGAGDGEAAAPGVASGVIGGCGGGGAGGRGIASHGQAAVFAERARVGNVCGGGVAQFSSLAQSVEQAAVNRRVAGSSPAACGAIFLSSPTNGEGR
jgi:hypothetical protein